KVKTLILADIKSGVYRPGDRIPTREQLVEKYSVTRTTVGQALKILVNAGVLSTSKRGGTIVTGKSMPLKVAFISVLGEAGADDIMRASEAENYGIFKPLLEAGSEFDLDFIDIKDLSPSDFKWTSKYDCMVWVMPGEKFLCKLPEYSNKALVINRYHKDINFISTNHRQAVREMTEYNLKLAGKDCQVFFLENARQNDFIYRERREGFVDACERAGKFYRFYDLSVSDYTSMQDALLRIEFEKDKNIVMVSPGLAYTGAVLQMAQRRGLVFGENFFYSDFDNRHSLRNTGIKIVSAIQDYNAMGRELLMALRRFGEEKIQLFVPYEIIK
ncbi:MAG: GntR family transcriptional regulator, partial [Victivallaceae bacterium]